MPEPAVAVVEQRPDLVLVRIELETVDDRNLDSLQAEVDAAGSAFPELPVAVDFGRVIFMPSVAMSGLVLLSRKFRLRKQRLVLFNLQPDVRSALVLMRLDRVMEIHQDLSGLTGNVG